MSKVNSLSKQKFQNESVNKGKVVEAHGNGKIERIQRRAYEIYQQRLQKQMPGDMISDWVKAEQEVNSLKMDESRRSCQQDFCKIGE